VRGGGSIVSSPGPTKKASGRCEESEKLEAGGGEERVWWEVGGGVKLGGEVIGPSGGWRWVLPGSRPSPGRCHKSPDICPVAPPPCR